MQHADGVVYLCDLLELIRVDQVLIVVIVLVGVQTLLAVVVGHSRLRRLARELFGLLLLLLLGILGRGDY